MSFNFQLQKINQSFERIAAWYHEFMHRTELCFRALNDRVIWLEERQVSQGVSDEQVERVLRKILAEKFSADSPRQTLKDHNMKESDYFVDNRRNVIPRPIVFDPSSLVVDPESVPSKAYLETIKMLEVRLDGFPNVDLKRVPQHGSRDIKRDH